jgi:hypothetical protein
LTAVVAAEVVRQRTQPMAGGVITHLLYALAMASMRSARELTYPLMIDSGKAPLVSKLICYVGRQTNCNIAPA